jgi:hypothetical protein
VISPVSSPQPSVRLSVRPSPVIVTVNRPGSFSGTHDLTILIVVGGGGGGGGGGGEASSVAWKHSVVRLVLTLVDLVLGLRERGHRREACGDVHEREEEAEL